MLLSLFFFCTVTFLFAGAFGESVSVDAHRGVVHFERDIKDLKESVRRLQISNKDLEKEVRTFQSEIKKLRGEVEGLRAGRLPAEDKKRWWWPF